MANKTKNTTTKEAPSIIEQASTNEAVFAATQADHDAKTALLIVSLLANSFVFITWVTLQVTSVYDYQFMQFMIG